MGKEDLIYFRSGKRVKKEKIKLPGPVVLTGGYFDLLHLGHAQFLEKCKGFGESLIVCVLADSIAKKIKGPTRPVIGEEVRAKIVSYLKPVDLSFVGDNFTESREIIYAVEPDILVLTRENRQDKLDRLRRSLDKKTREMMDIRFVSRSEYKRSTTQIIESIAGLSSA